MSRLRRLVVSDRWFFITCRLLPRRRILSASEFACLTRVIHERRAEHGFLLTAWVFLPEHWHAILHPPYPLTISTAMESIKDGATKRINRSRREVGKLFQPRFFDRALAGEALRGITSPAQYGERFPTHRVAIDP
jgi:REP element-mobilizing transposase RayT